jgi:hypothetical protein
VVPGVSERKKGRGKRRRGRFAVPWQLNPP